MLHFATEPSSIRWMVAMNAHWRPNEVKHHFFYVQCFNLPIIRIEIVIKSKLRGQISGNCNIPINYPMINLLIPTHWHKLAQLQFIFLLQLEPGSQKSHWQYTGTTLDAMKQDLFIERVQGMGVCVLQDVNINTCMAIRMISNSLIEQYK